jgi:competence protein ComEA
MIKLLKKYKYFITIIIVIILIVVSVLIRRELKLSNEEETIEEETLELIEEETEEEDNITETATLLWVDIKGAVVNPGVYEVESDKRVIDVVNLAGGLSDEANTSFINLAKKVEDSMVIIIYTNKEVNEAKKDDEIQYVIDNTCTCPSISNDACLESNTSSQSTTSDSESNSQLTDKININTASILDLESLPGIGTSKAQAIIDYRDTNGTFNTIEDIKNVSGIGDALYEKIKDYITV